MHKTFIFIWAKKIVKQNLTHLLKRVFSIFILLLLSTGCTQIPLPGRQLTNRLLRQPPEAIFQLTVTKSDRPGIYTVAGTTNLPEEIPITVAAIRYLHPNQQLSFNRDANFIYSILAYQNVDVKKGRWQTDLKLWQIAPDGQFQEVWQMDQSKLGLSLKPAEEVTFLATLTPKESLWELEEELKKQRITLASSLINNTSDGQRYVQARQVLSVALPTGQTKPPEPRPEDINHGWGKRYLLLPEPPIIYKLDKPNQRRIDAPLSTPEFLQ
ncbi:MAG: hypothetical protein F6J94_29885 [Moorea sp. SIO1F2]|uniref:hypothetical protein n=1 Tax=unclassified Moorena TaxID=2683338 RepID=UPI0013BCE162|nr:MULTISPECIES: hypothetical protein [unclassified Moorena]NEO18911.1 hypothetical protein [Moorena sp. SIO4A5]NEP21100.1 hypothetical protein [Moorena sp. SIO3I6]NEQ56242.1 hypothetical protein [Moorena sp. SIO4A1]NET85947.1 hypothetical protein [Moorena sp. SIO1F2]